MKPHTPGPWGIYNRWLVTANPDGTIPLNAKVLSDRNTIDGLSNADLVLVAAAPELLEALQGLMSVTAQFRAVHGLNPAQKELMNNAFTAIQKAKGVVE